MKDDVRIQVEINVVLKRGAKAEALISHIRHQLGNIYRPSQHHQDI